MDLKTLFNECRDQLRAEPMSWDHGDIHDIALEVILGDPDEFNEHYLDWIWEMLSEKDDTQRSVGVVRFSKGLTGMKTDLDGMESRRTSRELMATYSNSLTNSFHSIAGPIYFAIVKGAEKYIEENADQWIIDMNAYYNDMEQAQYEDYMDGVAEERRLEARDEG